MRSGLAVSEVIGTFENVYENDSKIKGLQTQIKALNEDSGEIFKASAADFETKPKSLKEAYKKWKAWQEGDKDDDDFFEICAMVAAELEITV
jgi:hypothetical protein